MQFVSGFLPTFTIVIRVTWGEVHGPLENDNRRRVPARLFLAVLTLSVIGPAVPFSPAGLH